MTSSQLLDTHIHLWPWTSVRPENHGWMSEGHQLAKRHGIQDYHNTTQSSPVQPSGFIYVETDRFLPSPTPDISEQDTNEEKSRKLKAWVKEPLEELSFLGRIVDGKPQEGDGFEPLHSSQLKGCVIWAPFHLSASLFQDYLKLAEEHSGVNLWSRVVGFRFLLQGKGEGGVKKLVRSDSWLKNVASLGKRWSFDVGVDCHRDGVETFEEVASMIERVRKLEGDGKEGRVKFVLNHLCKPNLATPYALWPSYPRWEAALSRLSNDPYVYMKISGAFNEFDPSPTPSSAIDVLTTLRPYLDHVLKCLPRRVMFGSDWPVCNVGGPRKEQSWPLWYEVVQKWVEEIGFDEEGEEDVWWRAGCEAYGIELGN